MVRGGGREWGWFRSLRLLSKGHREDGGGFDDGWKFIFLPRFFQADFLSSFFVTFYLPQPQTSTAQLYLDPDLLSPRQY